MPLRSDFFKALLDNFYDGVYFVDPDGRITYWNKGAERISGFSRSEVIDGKDRRQDCVEGP